MGPLDLGAATFCAGLLSKSCLRGCATAIASHRNPFISVTLIEEREVRPIAVLAGVWASKCAATKLAIGASMGALEVAMARFGLADVGYYMARADA